VSQNRPRAAVAVPAYRLDLDEDERISFRHLRRYLGPYDTFLVAPDTLGGTFEGLPAKHFDPGFFRDVRSYSALLLEPQFYRAFSSYDFLLVYQLDSLVLADELEAWCTRGYDYVGAPWTRRSPDGRVVLTGAGNGGFSLRRVASCLEVLDVARRPLARLRTGARHWTALVRRAVVRRSFGQAFLFEDKFWSYEAPRLCPWFGVAPAETALEFAFETEPRACFERNDRRLPFGCHNWALYDRAFWEPHLLDPVVR
jgi:Protein of unknown function (DUF5672)